MNKYPELLNESRMADYSAMFVDMFALTLQYAQG